MNPFVKANGPLKQEDSTPTPVHVECKPVQVTQQTFMIDDEEIRISDDKYTTKKIQTEGKYDSVFAVLEEGQRVVCHNRKQTDRIARALQAYLKKNRQGAYLIRTTTRYPTDGLMGVWYFKKKASKAGANG